MRSNSPKMPENAVSRAVRLGLIDKADEKEYLAMACADIEAFDEVVARKEARAKAKFDIIFLSAARDGRVDATNRAFYEEIAQAGGHALCERIIGLIPKPRSVVSMIEENHSNGTALPRSEWGLSEYRKYAPEELRDNPELYVSLLEKEGRLKPLTAETVDYYRRYHPEYLANHPREYARVMSERRDIAELKK